MDVLSPFFHTWHVLIWLIALPVAVVLIYYFSTLEPPPFWAILLNWAMVPILFAHSETANILAAIPGMPLLGKLAFLALKHPFVSLCVAVVLYEIRKAPYAIVSGIFQNLIARKRRRTRRRIIKRGYAKSKKEYLALFPHACPACCSRYFYESGNSWSQKGEYLTCKNCNHIMKKHWSWTLERIYTDHGSYSRTNSGFLSSEKNNSFPNFDCRTPLEIRNAPASTS